MRIIKLIGIITFLAALTILGSSKLARTSAALADNKNSKSSGAADPSQYIGSDACAECHSNQAALYAVTAHRKTNVHSNPLDKQGCEACHGGAKKHVEFYQTAQKLIAQGKDAEAQAR